MVLKNINHDLGYHTQKLATMFFPLEKIKSDGEDAVTVVTSKEGRIITVDAEVYSKHKKQECEIFQRYKTVQT